MEASLVGPPPHARAAREKRDVSKRSDLSVGNPAFWMRSRGAAFSPLDAYSFKPFTVKA